MRTGKTISKATREAFKKTLAFAQIQEWCKIHQLSRQKQDSLLTQVIQNCNYGQVMQQDGLNCLFRWQNTKEGFDHWEEIDLATAHKRLDSYPSMQVYKEQSK